MFLKYNSQRSSYEMVTAYLWEVLSSYEAHELRMLRCSYATWIIVEEINFGLSSKLNQLAENDVSIFCIEGIRSTIVASPFSKRWGRTGCPVESGRRQSGGGEHAEHAFWVRANCTAIIVPGGDAARAAARLNDFRRHGWPTFRGRAKRRRQADD